MLRKKYYIIFHLLKEIFSSLAYSMSSNILNESYKVSIDMYKLLVLKF